MVAVERLAESIVRESLRPREYEVVVISTYPHTTDLAEQVALECQRAGADPLILLDTDAVFYGQFDNYSLESLRTTSAHCLGLAEYTDSYVWLGGPKDPGPMALVPQERWAAMFQGEQAHYEKSLAKKHKSVGVALGQVTPERARTYGFDHGKWKDMVESAIAVDYGDLGAVGRRLADLLTRGKEVRIRAANGTDLRLLLAGPERQAHIDDGAIGEEDIAAGNTEVQLPAGSVWIAPREDSARGTFAADVPIPQMGQLIEGLAWAFDGGHVKDFQAKRNVALAQVNWAEGTGDKDRIGGLGIGLNPRALPGFLQNPIAAGTVTVSIGDNRSFGGTNQSSYGFSAPLANGTVEIDGRTVVETGRLML